MTDVLIWCILRLRSTRWQWTCPGRVDKMKNRTSKCKMTRQNSKIFLLHRYPKRRWDSSLWQVGAQNDIPWSGYRLSGGAGDCELIL